MTPRINGTLSPALRLQGQDRVLGRNRQRTDHDEFGLDSHYISMLLGGQSSEQPRLFEQVR